MADLIYNSKDWVNGETITEQDLDRIEQGIAVLYANLGSPHAGFSKTIFDALYDLTAAIGDNTDSSSSSIINQLRELTAKCEKIGNTDLIDDTIIEIIQDLQTQLENANIESLGPQIRNLVNSTIDNKWTNDVQPSINQAISGAQSAQAAAEAAQTAAQEATDDANSAVTRAEAAQAAAQQAATDAVTNAQTAATTAANTAINNAMGGVQAALGADYYDNNAWTTIDGTTNKSVTTRLDAIEETLGSSTSTGGSLVSRVSGLETDVDEIQDYLGLDNQSSSQDSLIDKIEGALGRAIELEQDETKDPQTGEYAHSIMTLIRQIQGVLGIQGGVSDGTTSNLVNDIDLALKLLSGYIKSTDLEDPENIIITRNPLPDLTDYTIVENYPSLYNEVYNSTISYTEPVVDEHGDPVLINDEPQYTTITSTGSLKALLNSLYNRFGSVNSSNAYLIQRLGNYDDVEEKVENSYEYAETATYNDNSYLILKRDRSAELAESLDDLDEAGEYQGSTYIQLPKGGGGGTTQYEFQARYVDVVYPTNTTITIGDAVPIRFTWSVTDDQNSPVTILGNLAIKVNNTTVYNAIIESGTAVSYNLGQYINTNGRNTITIAVTNDIVPTRTLYVTIMAYRASLTSTFNENDLQLGSSIEYQYTASIGSNIISKTLHIQIDGTEVALTNNVTTTETQNTIYFPTPTVGSHLMRVWFEAAVSDTNTIVSNSLYYGILCGASNDTRIASNFVNGTEVERYSTITVHYLVYTPNQSTTRTEFYINDSTTPITTLNAGITYQDWTYVVTNAAGPLTITIKANGVEKVLTATVVDTNNYDLSMVTSGLRLFLTADQRSNSESNPNHWENLSTNENSPNVNVALENFLYYRTIDGWQQDEDGAYFLRLRNQNKVTIPFSVFNNSGANRNNIAETGMTLEIDFKTQDVADYDTKIIQCFEGTSAETSSKNIILTPQNAIFNNVKSLITQYKEEEKITIDFVINPSIPQDGSTRTPQKSDGLLYIYINGILSAATPYQQGSGDVPNLGFTDPDNAKIILGSTECTLDIYSIKFYESALTYKEVIKNWVYNTGNFDEKIARYNRNNYNTFDINTFVTNSPNTPYMVITGEGPLDGENAWMPQQKGSDYKKTVDVYYIDPVHPELSFSSNSLGLEEFSGKTSVQVQGTSSQAYFRKNYKIKMDSFTQNGIFHIKKPEEGNSKYYKTITDPETGETVVTSELLDNVTKEGYKLRENSYPEFTFCIKADVASSESVNNTGLTMIYDEAIRNFVTTPPQHDDARVRQGVEGYPMVAWYRYTEKVDENSAPIIHEVLLGKYNFNHDKGTEKVYGLKSSLDLDVSFAERDFNIENGIYDESWEVKNNDANTLVMFEVAGAPNTPEREAAWYKTETDNNGKTTMEWQKSFESRFPDQDDEKIVTITDTQSSDFTYLQTRLSGLRQMVEWVNDTVQWADQTKTSITPESLANFKAGFSNYFNLDAMLFFYLFTELFLMVDNRAKNMFWTRYQVIDGKRPKTTGYDDHVNTLAPNNNSYFGWFTYPYDFDTALGINNQGKNVYDYHWESLDVTGADGSAIFGGQYSKLWVAFRQAYETEIAAFYPQMTRYITYNMVEGLFERNQSIWSETIVNEDMIVKYINWGADIGYDMLLGLKDMQRKWWLYNRFKYFNSKFAIERGTDNINLRIHVNNANIPVQVYADSYVSVNVGANGAPTTVRVLRGQTKNLVVGSENAGETDSSGIETYISPASALKSIQNLSTFKISSLDVSKAIRLQELRIGTPDVAQANTRLRSVNVTPAAGYTSLLRIIDLRNCTVCGLLTNTAGEVITTSPTLNVSGCIFLNKIYLAGTPLHTVSLPNGGVLETVQYPATIKEINIENQPYLTNLIIGSGVPENEISDSTYETAYDGVNDYSNITAVRLNNIGEQVDVPAIINGSNVIETCELSNLTFRMTGSEFKTFFDKLNEIDAVITNCTLYLQDNLPDGFTVNMITERFDIKVFDSEGNEYYNVRFYNFTRELISTLSVVGNSGIDGSIVSTYFTEDYLNEYNGLTQENMSMHPTRLGFGNWDSDLENIQNDMDVYPVQVTQYRMDFHYLENKDIPKIYYSYFTPDERVTRYSPPDFILNYYIYRLSGWTTDDNEPANYPDDDTRVINTETINKQAQIEHLYAVYQHNNPALYNINVYNTDANGNKIGNPLNSAPIQKTVVGGNNKITESDLTSYLPSVGGIAFSADEINVPLANRKYQFLNWKPYIPSTGLQVTGDMDVLLTYYKTDDYYTNYFINKLVECDLGTIASLPQASFVHNSKLRKLIINTASVGAYSFSNFGTDGAENNAVRYFTFTGSNITLGAYCFAGMANGRVIFNAPDARITVDSNAFASLHNCIIIIPNSDYTINALPNAIQSFYDLGNNNNIVYVTQAAYNAYITGGNSSIPTYLSSSNVIYPINDSNEAAINSILEEAQIL